MWLPLCCRLGTLMVFAALYYKIVSSEGKSAKPKLDTQPVAQAELGLLKHGS